MKSFVFKACAITLIRGCIFRRISVLYFTDPRFLYGTVTTISLLEFKGKESSETELFSSKEGILSFDVDWFREWLYWANQTGHVQRTKLTLDKTEFISIPLPGVICKKPDCSIKNLFCCHAI